jgi:flagellar basal body-associated protein FliL
MPEESVEKKEVQKDKPKLPIKTILIVLGVLLLEGGTISLFFVVKGGKPLPAAATDPIEQTQQSPSENLAEVVLIEDASVDNYVGGKTKIIVTLQVAAKVEIANKDKLDAKVKEHKNEIMNTIRVVVSSAKPTEIRDPKIQVIKRQMHVEIEKIIGEELIKEVLLPVWTTYVAD